MAELIVDVTWPDGHVHTLRAEVSLVDDTVPQPVVLPPSINVSAFPLIIVAGQPVNVPVPVTGTGPIALGATGTLPPGINFQGGAFVGSTLAVGGPYSLTLTATGPSGLIDVEIVSITVAAASTAPVILTDALPNAVAGTAYNAPLVASGLPAPTFSLGSDKPAWASIAGSSIVGNVPASGPGGDQQVTVTATNPSGAVSRPFTLRTLVPASFTTASTLPLAVQGEPYEVAIEAAGTGLVTVALADGAALPAGFTFIGRVLRASPVGLLPGTYTIAMTASNGVGAVAQRTFSIPVSASSSKAAITTQFLPDAVANLAYLAQIETTGADPKSFSVGAGFPPGMSLSSTTGEISGTPTAPGGYVFEVVVANAAGPAARKSLAITVLGADVVSASTPWTKFSTAGGR